MNTQRGLTTQVHATLRRHPVLADLAHRSRSAARSFAQPPSRAVTTNRIPTATTVPQFPLGAKLELTHRCNLLCSFCYTDSPMKTLRRDPELTNAEWMELVDQVIAVGVVEVVLTGGEPLLRKKLTLDAARKFSAAGVAVIVNTNGWFVDEATAAALATIPGVRVSVSIDGVTPELHDVARGVPGSWIRAVEGTNRLLAHGADVRINHVVTPTNEHEVEAFVDAMVAFGVRSLRVTAAGLGVGATSREGDWRLNGDRLGETIRVLQRRHSGRLAMRYLPQEVSSSFEEVPEAFLLRPDGSMVLDSHRPLRFGAVPVDVASAWAEVRAFWSTEGDAGLKRKLSGHVAYREDDVLAGAQAAGDSSGAVVATPVSIGQKPASSPESDTTSGRTPRHVPLGVPVMESSGDVRAGRELLDSFAGARRYRTAKLRWAGNADGERSLRTATGAKHSVDYRAGSLLDACQGGIAAAHAIDAASRACGVSSSELAVVFRDLVGRKLILADPVLVPTSDSASDCASDSLSDVRVSEIAR